MIEPGTSTDLEVEYDNLLKLLSHTAKYLEGLDIDPSVLKSYRRLVHYLRTRSASVQADILGDRAQPVVATTRRSKEGLSDKDILSMDPDRVLSLALSEDVPRRELERIAILRFGMTRGGLSSLRNREALIDKIRILIENEGTHASISRLASRESHLP